MVAWGSFYHVVEKEVAYLKGKSFGKIYAAQIDSTIIFCVCPLDSYRIVHVALNEYIHHVVELLQLKVIEAQFNGSLIPSACKLDCSYLRLYRVL